MSIGEADKEIAAAKTDFEQGRDQELAGKVHIGEVLAVLSLMREKAESMRSYDLDGPLTDAYGSAGSANNSFLSGRAHLALARGDTTTSGSGLGGAYEQSSELLRLTDADDFSGIAGGNNFGILETALGAVVVRIGALIADIKTAQDEAQKTEAFLSTASTQADSIVRQLTSR